MSSFLVEANMCRFFLSFVYLCIAAGDTVIKKGIPLTGLIPPNVCSCSKLGLGLPTSYVMVFLCSATSVKIWGDCSFCWYWWIVDHHCLNILLFCWYWWIVDYHCLNFLFSFVLLILVTYVDYHCLNFLLFCWYWWIVDYHCLNFLLFCWYWWIVDYHCLNFLLFCFVVLVNCWLSLFKLSFITV